MYNFDKDFNFETISKEDIINRINTLEANKPEIKIADFTLSLNPFIMLNFTEVTNHDYFDVMYQLFKEAKDFNTLITLAEKLCNETIGEYSNENLSGVLNYLMSELSERLSLNKTYKDNLIDLLLYDFN